MSAKWDWDKTEHLSCGQYYYEYYFVRGDEPKEWTLHETAQHLSAKEVMLDAQADEIKRLRDALEACNFRLRDALAGKEAG
jgi:hypothetical protein